MSQDKQSKGADLVKRLLTPQEVDSIGGGGGDFTTYAQIAGGYCKFDQKSGGYEQICPPTPGNPAG